MGHHRLATPDLGRIFGGDTILGLSEWELLDRYLERRDEVAFEALVARHGPMVLAVCRRMLICQTDVEDAFQATFLVLVRRAPQLGPRDAIGPWLYGVATRVALRARCEAARRHRVESLPPDLAAIGNERGGADVREIGAVLDEELSRLPTKYRHPIVLCYLEGHTHEEAARQLKWPLGTVKGRLSRARNLLQARLARRGVAPAVGAVSFVLSPDSRATPHRELLDRTVQASFKLASGQAVGQIVSASITSLVEGVLASMFINNLRWAGVTALVCGLALTGVGVMARQDGKAKVDVPPTVLKDRADESTTAVKPAEKVAAPNTGAQDELSKIIDLRKEHIKAAAREWAAALAEFSQKPSMGIEPIYQASKRLMDAQLPLSDSPDLRIARASEHFDRIRAIARAHQSSSSPSEFELAQLATYVAQAGLWLAQARAGDTEKPRDVGSSEETKDGRGNDPKSRLILAALDKPVSMPFNEDTPLEEVLKYIKQSTATAQLPGHPDLRRSPRPSGSRKIHDVDGQGHGPPGRAAPADVATAVETARPDLLRRGWHTLYHVQPVRRPVGVVGPGDGGAIPDLAEGRQSRARRDVTFRNEGPDRTLQNSRADHEAFIGTERGKTRGSGIEQAPRGSQTRPRTDELVAQGDAGADRAPEVREADEEIG